MVSKQQYVILGRGVLLMALETVLGFLSTDQNAKIRPQLIYAQRRATGGSQRGRWFRPRWRVYALGRHACASAYSAVSVVNPSLLQCDIAAIIDHRTMSGHCSEHAPCVQSKI